MAIKKCKYKSYDGQCCEEEDLGSGFCFWHDPDIDKSNMDLSQRLEEHAKSGALLQGLKLARANLSNVNLVKHGHKTGYDLKHSDFYRANMSNAHLFNADLEGASLMKAKLSEANLHCANLHNCNLLGVKLTNARMDNVKLGQYVQQEAVAKRAELRGEREKAVDFYEQSEEIYRALRKAADDDGLTKLAGKLAYKELTMQRKQRKKFSMERIMLKLVDLFCGYGEKPMNVIIFSMGLILISALMFFFLGVDSADGIIKFDPNHSTFKNLQDLGSAIYFSVVTFTTLGYGDIHPHGFARLVATIEAFIGSFALALYVVVFVKKSSR